MIFLWFFLLVLQTTTNSTWLRHNGARCFFFDRPVLGIKNGSVVNWVIIKSWNRLETDCNAFKTNFLWNFDVIIPCWALEIEHFWNSTVQSTNHFFLDKYMYYYFYMYINWHSFKNRYMKQNIYYCINWLNEKAAILWSLRLHNFHTSFKVFDMKMEHLSSLCIFNIDFYIHVDFITCSKCIDKLWNYTWITFVWSSARAKQR